jgi:cytochrome oxidase Cu insertion factor (SCO1/SenC/PrrC family)
VRRAPRAGQRESAKGRIVDPDPGRVGLLVVFVVGLVLTRGLAPAMGDDFRTNVLHPTRPAPGHIVALSFGYTFCPGFCPMVLGKLARARGQLGRFAPGVRVVFVAVDPARYTPDRLLGYTAALDTTFISVTGTPLELARVQHAYGVVAQPRRPRDGSGASLIDHSAPVIVIDGDGQLSEGRHPSR